MPNRMMANRRSPVLLALLVAGLALSSAALAQVTRVAVFPFDVPASAQAYQLGLSGAVQRSLNQIPNVYAAPVGDVALVANRAVATEQDVERTVGRLFDASALITGEVTLAGGGVAATVNVEIGGGVQTVQASGEDPATLAAATSRQYQLRLGDPAIMQDPEMAEVVQRAQAVTQEDLAAVDVEINPRYGDWDVDHGGVVPEVPEWIRFDTAG